MAAEIPQQANAKNWHLCLRVEGAQVLLTAVVMETGVKPKMGPVPGHPTAPTGGHCHHGRILLPESPFSHCIAAVFDQDGLFLLLHRPVDI